MVRLYILGIRGLLLVLVLAITAPNFGNLKEGKISRVQFQDTISKIRVINKSGIPLTYVSLFSMRFENLQPGDTSAYKNLRYDPLRDDPLIYCVGDGTNLGRYLNIPDAGSGRVSFVVDSISDGILYVSSLREKIP